jgi:hypothetical protein
MNFCFHGCCQDNEPVFQFRQFADRRITTPESILFRSAQPVRDEAVSHTGESQKFAIQAAADLVVNELPAADASDDGARKDKVFPNAIHNIDGVGVFTSI